MLSKIISGGQTGVDQAALRAAKAEGYQTGGWVPKGCRTEAGPAPWLITDYGCREAAHRDYSVRTGNNVRDSHATLIIGHPSVGCNQTQTFCGRAFYNKPWYWLRIDKIGQRPLHEVEAEVRQWIWGLPGLEILNIAGNREENYPGLGAWAQNFIEDVLIPF